MVDFPGISLEFGQNERAVLYVGDCLDLLKSMPAESVQLVATSPPYNMGKEYENRLDLERYLDQQKKVIAESWRVLKNRGSICWQVGNYVQDGAIIPIDSLIYPIFAGMKFKLRNRIIWHFEHGLHCSRRLSGRYETINWFTKGEDYYFDVDRIRVPQKYPGKKYFKGPKAGQYSCNPLGKNPGDVWTIPNVKSNHVEKTSHPCQFPVELIERLVLAFTQKDDWVFDPFLGSGTTIIAALRHGRRGAGAELFPKYVEIARDRIHKAASGELLVRPMARPVFDPRNAGRNLTTAPWLENGKTGRPMELFENISGYRPKK